MGQEQPKKLNRVNKSQIDIASLKAKIHLELVRDRKHQEVIKGEKELVAKIKNKTRNKVEEILIAERIISGLKYANACTLLMSYAASIRMQAHFLAQNMNNPQKLEPFLEMIYSLIYAADHMGLSSLQEFKALMRALNDPMTLEKYVNRQILQALIPKPSSDELNIYMVEMSERNGIPLDEINMGGHKFTKDPKGPGGPNNPSTKGSGFTDLQKMLGEDLNKRFNQGGFGGPGNMGPGGMGPGGMGPGGYSGNGGNGANGGYGGFGGGSVPPNNNLGPGGNQYVGGNNPNINPPPGSYTPANLGPDFYIPGDIASKHKEGGVRQSINSINDIDYYPEMQANPALFNKDTFNDPNFDELCERLRKGL